MEAARKKLNDHRIGLNIERDLSTLLELISSLEEAQGMVMPESQKFGILRVLMAHEERVHVRNIVGIASYNKENFNFTIKKIREEWDATPMSKNNVQMAAATEPVTTDRICFKFQTNECTRKGCPYIHRIMNDHEKKDQKYNNKRPAGKEFNNKPLKKPNKVRNSKVRRIQEITILKGLMGCITACHRQGDIRLSLERGRGNHLPAIRMDTARNN